MANEAEKSVIAKLKREGKNFEILVYPEKALEYKKGKPIPINDVIVVEEIFTDSKKGLRASEGDLERGFGTLEKLEICKTIIKDGDVQQTADMLRKGLEERRKQVAHLIHRSCIDPVTGKPHPQQRIENAITEAKVRITDEDAEKQVKDVIDSIKRIIPIKFETRVLSITIHGPTASKCFQTLKQYGTVSKERWLNDGSLNVILEIPAGLQEELEIDLNRLTKGHIETEIVEKR
ncbi:MAG: ribosome assembly factor SBDS [Nanoarchaeota archaeon]